MESAELKNRMKDLPVSEPYCDWEALMAIEPPTKRYELAITQILPDSPFYEPENGIDENRMPEFEVARWMAAKTLISRIKDRGYIIKHVAEETSVDRSLFSHMTNGNRSFCVQPSSMEILRKFTDCSCHRLLFGEEGAIVLPKRLNAIVYAMNTVMERKDVEFLCSMAKKEYEEYCRENSNGKYPPLQHKTYTELLWQRVGMLREDQYLDEAETFGRLGRTPYQFKSMLKLLWDKKAEDQYEPKLQFLMYAALNSGLALDFFVCERPVKHVAVFTTNIHTGTPVSVTDVELVDFINNVLSLDDKRQEKLIIMATGKTAPLYINSVI